MRKLLGYKTANLVLSSFSGSISSLSTSIMINPYDAGEISRAIREVMKEPLENQEAKFEHDVEQIQKSPVGDWVKSWLADTIRANNRTTRTVMITVGIGKTARLLRMRNDFHMLDESSKAAIGKAYSKAKNRLILLDNDVSAASQRVGNIGSDRPVQRKRAAGHDESAV